MLDLYLKYSMAAPVQPADQKLKLLLTAELEVLYSHTTLGLS